MNFKYFSVWRSRAKAQGHEMEFLLRLRLRQANVCYSKCVEKKDFYVMKRCTLCKNQAASMFAHVFMLRKVLDVRSCIHQI